MSTGRLVGTGKVVGSALVFAISLSYFLTRFNLNQELLGDSTFLLVTFLTCIFLSFSLGSLRETDRSVELGLVTVILGSLFSFMITTLVLVCPIIAVGGDVAEPYLFTFLRILFWPLNFILIPVAVGFMILGSIVVGLFE
jgi:hypothetical protein